MDYFIWAVILWLLVVILIPFERIKELWAVAVISVVWLFIVNYFSVKLGYYKFFNPLSIGGSPFFLLVGGAAGGILLINWVKQNPLSKVLLVFVASIYLYFTEAIFLRLGTFQYGSFNTGISIIQSIAMFSIQVWLSLALLGHERVYEGNKTRFIK